MAQQILNVLSDETINYLISHDEVMNAKARIEAKPDSRASERFTIPLTPALRSELLNNMNLNLDLYNVTVIPMRWIKGDTPSHHDNGTTTFTHTYLVYLNDSNGSLLVDGVTYPITRGVGYRFSEGLSHETVGTTDDTEPRLLLGPMSETGFAVGEDPTISYPGGTTVYLRQTAVGQDVLFSTDLHSDVSTWIAIPWPCNVTNTNVNLGILNVEFISNITLDAEIGDILGYFICKSGSIQFGSRTLMPDGSRPIITFDGVENYLGLIENGNSGSDAYNNVHIMNLEIRAAGGSTVANEAGWFGQYYFGKGTTTASNIIMNCHSTGSIREYGGGIIGRYAGPLKLSHCSSSGSVGQYGGGIVGSHSPSSGVLHCESCWSSGTIGEHGGGITGIFTGIATIVNCYSTGSIGTHAGGIAGSSSGGNNGTNMFTLSQCYSTGAIGEYGGGIIGQRSGDLHVSNSYSIGYINANAGGILGNLAGNTTNKTVSSCYVAGAMHETGGYIMPGYADLTGSVTVVGGVVTLTNNFAEASISSSGWNTSRANNVLTGVPASASEPIGVKWVYTGLNTPYEILVMGFTPYTHIVVAGSPPAMVKHFSSTVVAGISTAPALISGRSYSILRITGGNGTYSLISVNGTTGSIQTSRATVPGVYTVMIRNNGSYHITTYTLTVTPYIPYSMFGMFTNNAQVYYKSHSLASGGVGGVRNHRRKARKT
jgi:hypothetical protein